MYGSINCWVAINAITHPTSGDQSLDDGSSTVFSSSSSESPEDSETESGPTEAPPNTQEDQHTSDL